LLAFSQQFVLCVSLYTKTYLAEINSRLCVLHFGKHPRTRKMCAQMNEEYQQPVAIAYEQPDFLAMLALGLSPELFAKRKRFGSSRSEGSGSSGSSVGLADLSRRKSASSGENVPSGQAASGVTSTTAMHNPQLVVVDGVLVATALSATGQHVPPPPGPPPPQVPEITPLGSTGQAASSRI
jgi:hypothetical protein